MSTEMFFICLFLGIPCPVPVVNNASLDLNQEFYVGNKIHVNCHSGYMVDGSTDQHSAEFACGVEDPPKCLSKWLYTSSFPF